MATPGAVLIFLPGWSLIFALQKFLQEKKMFGMYSYLLLVFSLYLFYFVSGSSSFCILPLHSQLPCADQRKVFESVPPGVRKVN